MSNNSKGSKFDSSLSLAQIAANVRAAVKAAIKGGAIPKGTKVSVRSETYSGGGAIRISITAVPDGFAILNAERVAHDLANPCACLPEYMMARYTPEASALLSTISAFASDYNYDRSDIQRDYFCVNFYDGRAKFSHELESAERSTLEAVAAFASAMKAAA